MAEGKLIPNIDYLGTAYDVVEMDPLNLGDTSKNHNIFALSVQDGWASPTPDGIYLVPNGVNHHAPFSMGYESASTAMSSSYEFQQEVKLQVDVDAGVEGAFEFSASASNRDVEKVTESRDRTFSYFRAYQDDHILDLDLDNENAPLALRPEFQHAVLALPNADEVPDWQQKYDDFVGTWGTHFTKGIVLGGLAYQRVSGKASTLLRSTESEKNLEAGASAEFEAFKGGAKLDSAYSQAESKASDYSLELGKLEFRGGDGGTGEIASTWFQSCVDRPAVTRATLERLSYLLTPRFFPNKDNIDEIQGILDRAITDSIQTRGKPSASTAPLRYGEPVVVVFPWADGKTKQVGVYYPGQIQVLNFPVRIAGGIQQPVYDENQKAALRILSGDGSNKDGVILAGDQVRIEVIDKGFFGLGDKHTPGGDGGSIMNLEWTNSPSDAARFTILHRDDNLTSPGRLGEYFESSDLVAFVPVAALTDGAICVRTGDRTLYVLENPAPNVSGFFLMRCEEQEEG
jgi:hypothetical protein